MFTRLVLVGVLLAAAGCGTSDTGNRPEARPTRAAGPDYETRVNALCADLVDRILPITGDKQHPSPEEYLAFGRKIDPVIHRFDVKVDALEVSDADKSAAAAFDAYRARVDDADAVLRKVARTGDDDAFATAFTTFLTDLSSAPEKTALSAEGIVCPAR